MGRHENTKVVLKGQMRILGKCFDIDVLVGTVIWSMIAIATLTMAAFWIYDYTTDIYIDEWVECEVVYLGKTVRGTYAGEGMLAGAAVGRSVGVGTSGGAMFGLAVGSGAKKYVYHYEVTVLGVIFPVESHFMKEIADKVLIRTVIDGQDGFEHTKWWYGDDCLKTITSERAEKS